MSIAKHIPAHIKRVCRCLGYVLWLDDTASWFGLPIILRARLDERQRAALAYATLKSMDRDNALLTAETALSEGAGQPIAPLFNHMDEAAFWADMASPDEVEAYCFASFNAMPRPRQAAFLEFVQGRQVA
ncbi:hypothetical protein [Sulfitobacter geojensis]|uniref:hypothetical protein n=1 Tax=Sulfitobacter geojensis TaxID=1342299 RepID=UPI0007D9F0F5|nr:hypothetical protein [Sulfitobacter geojensis]OAN86068.1 hypothetical protein A8B74_07415 [Sulfitobacter geojensis]